MEKRQKILVVIDGNGEYQILGEKPDDYEVHWFDCRDFDDPYLDHKHQVWRARDTLVEAENWPDLWKNAVNLEWLCELVENEGIELPDWIRAHKNKQMLETLRQLETM